MAEHPRVASTAAPSLTANADLVVVAIGALLAAAASIVAAPLVVRLPLGLAAALALPGYTLSHALLPRGTLDGIERAALAITLSVAVVIVAAPILDRLPGGLTPPALTWTVTGVTLGGTAAAWWRRRRGPGVGGDPIALRWPAILGLAVGAILVGAVVALRLAGAAPGPSEFYVVGSGGTTDGLPVLASPGSTVTVAVGIVNHASSEQAFRVGVQSGGAPLGGAGPITIGADGTWTGTIAFAAPPEGPGREVLLVLYRQPDPEPFRSLRLFLDVVAPSPSASGGS